MNKLIIFTIIWIMISVYNYVKYIPQEQKNETEFLTFIAFAIFSPLLTFIIYVNYIINWILNK